MGSYIENELKGKTSYRELGEWVLEQDSQIARHGSARLIELAYEKQDFDWAVDYVNKFVTQSKSEADSRSVVVSLAKLMIKEDPRDAMKWGVTIPEDTPGKHTVLVKAFSALNQKDRNASLAMIKLVRSEETRKSLLSIDQHLENRRLQNAKKD